MTLGVTSIVGPFMILGAICIDSSTLKLVDGDAPTEGKVIVNGMPVCNDGWTENDSQVYGNVHHLWGRLLFENRYFGI